ncbi:hypothetical protein WQE_23523 [Paraburkholderia hospita]|uniref:Uncharacterized protein n=1 Tax=Paraburkholderia hospita TaxID=169430 RepID=A0ABN0FIK7_9BURK|nr:hypothetical protein [Paraburkholderia hospita]EIM98551.1 hypothetical protein WQE_23523 [Paraburkholderia hospita]OUL86624.1 hypothetical protein CA602_15440 [Paraburkholderia hospita]
MARENARGALHPLAQARSGGQINIRMNRLTVRFEHFVHLDTMLIHEDFADPVRAIIDSEFDNVRDALIESGMTFSGIARSTRASHLENFFTHLAGEHDMGFLVKAQQPYFLIADSNRLEYSWERSRSSWFYARSYAALLDKVCDWAAFHHEEAWARAKSVAGAGPAYAA